VGSAREWGRQTMQTINTGNNKIAFKYHLSGDYFYDKKWPQSSDQDTARGWGETIQTVAVYTGNNKIGAKTMVANHYS
jgi:hypothetical protein